MSIATLAQVYDEVRRLAIAGSSVAVGDFRLKKLIAPLEQAGAKAPIFAKLAQSVQAVVDSTEQTAPSSLLELTTLVSAVLYTQGVTGIEGPMTPIQTTDLGIQSTQSSARTIKPLLVALSSVGSGRLEIVKDAVEKNLFRDLRLVKVAVQAIDDPYPEIADLVVKQVLPMYGAAILPDLQSSFDLKSKQAGQARRLLLMHQLAPAATRALVEQTLAEGSKELKIAAIECLGESEADTAYLIEQSKAKAKDVRAAALRAMVRAPHHSAELLKSLLKALEGDDIELFAPSIIQHRIPAVDDAIVAQLAKQVDQLFNEKEIKPLGLATQRAISLVLCMQGRQDAMAEQLLFDLFARAPKLAKLKGGPSGVDLNEAIALCMSLSTERVKRHLAEHALTSSGLVFQAALKAAHDLYPPDTFFQVFHPVLEAMRTKKRSADLERAETLERLLTGGGALGFHRLRGAVHVREHKTDPRWLDLAVELQRHHLVYALFLPDHSKAAEFLASAVISKQASWIRIKALEALAAAHYPGTLQLLIQLAENQKTEDWYIRYGLQQVISMLPASAAAALEDALPNMPPKLVDVLIDAIADLKLTSE